MANYKRLTVGERPVVVSFPEWLLHDDAVEAAYRALRRALGPVPVYVDAASVVLVIPHHLLDAPAALWALARLQDDVTVWRLASHDGTRAPTSYATGGWVGVGTSARARWGRHARRRGHAPPVCGWIDGEGVA